MRRPSIFDSFSSQKDDPRPGPTTSGLDGRKVVFIATGSIAVMYLPAWLAWFRDRHPSTEFRVVLTTSALNFVGSHAVNTYSNSDYIVDDWASVGGHALHVELETWADGFIVHPATVDYVSRLAAGLCNSPSLLTIQGTRSPIVVAPSLPPQYLESDVWRQHVTTLGARKNITVLDPIRGESTFAQGMESYPPQTFPVTTDTLARILSTDSDWNS